VDPPIVVGDGFDVGEKKGCLSVKVGEEPNVV
jgi:hypothetical protein